MKYLNHSRDFLSLNALHVLNDGFQASLLLLLPFIAASQHLSLTEVGALGTIINVAGIVFALPAGYLAVRFGGVKILLVALLLYALGFAGSGLLGGNYWILAVLFLVAGVGFGVFHPIAFALIAKWAPKERRGRSIGNFTAIGDVGRIGISALVSVIVVAIGWQKTALLYAAFALILGVGIALFAHNQPPKTKDTAQPLKPMTFWQILRNRRLIFTLSAAALDSFASSSLYVFLPFLLLERGVDPVLLGSFTAAFFFGNLFGKTFLGRLTDKLGSVKVFIVAELLMALFIIILANVLAFWVIIVCAIVLGIFTKGTVPVLQAMMSESVEHHGHFEKTFGLSGMVTGAAVAIAPILLGTVSDHAGIVVAFNAMGVAALLAVIPALGYYFAKQAKTA